MSVYLLTSTLEDEIQKLMNSFWWDSKSGSTKGINWLNLQKLTMTKEFGDLRFRHYYGFNIAMLG